MRQRSLVGTVVVITGGTRGIGQQVAKDLHGMGAQVIVCGLHAGDLPPAIDSRLCDVRDDDQVAEFGAAVLSRYGAVDVLINNAGYAVYRPFEESTAEEVVDIVDVNLNGAMRMAKAFLPSMIARRKGKILNIASVGGALIITPNAAYCAAKHGMIAWTKALRYELARFNVSATAICPDQVQTHFQDHATFRRRDPFRKKKKFPLTIQKVSATILEAIDSDRAVLYSPSWLGVVVWCANALPWLANPLWKRMMSKRMHELYQTIEAEETSPNT